MTEGRVTIRETGPYVGVQELVARQIAGSFEALLNYELQDGVVHKRRGRLLLLTLNQVSPGAFVVTNDWTPDPDAPHLLGNNATDYQQAVVGDQGEGFISGAGTAGALYIFAASPFDNVEILELGTANTVISSLSAFFFDGTGFTAVAGLVDGTAAGGNKTFGQAGTITWTMPTTWQPIGAAFNGQLQNTSHEDLARFPWVIQFRFSVALTANTSVKKCRINYNAAVTAGPINGVAEAWNHRLIAGMDDRAQNIARLYVYNQQARLWSQQPMPRGVETDDRAQWRFLNIENKTLCVNGRSPILVYDGNGLAPLAKGTGANSATQAYGDPPRPAFLALWRARVVAAGGSLGSNAQFSEYHNALALFTDGAVQGPGGVGGANYWPFGEDLSLLTDKGDEVTGVHVVGDDLVFLKERTVFVYDGFRLRKASDHDGCIAPASAVVDRDRLYFLGERGFLMYRERGTVELLPGLDKTLLQHANRGAIARAQAVLYRKKNQYRCWIPIGFSERNRLCCVLNLDPGPNTPMAWSYFGAPFWMTDAEKTTANVQEYEVRAAVVSGRTVDQEVLYTVDYAGHVWVEDYGDDDGGKAIYAVLVSRRYGFNDQQVRSGHDARLIARREGEVAVEAWVLRDGESWYGVLASGRAADYTVTLSEKADPEFGVSSGDHAALFGNDVWTTDDWKAWPLSLPGGGSARALQLMLRQKDDNAPLSIKGYEWEVEVRGGART